MKRITVSMLCGAVISGFALGATALPAQASPEPDDPSTTAVVELDPAPEGYWTPERIAEAQPMGTPDLDASPGSSSMMRKSTPFPEEPWQNISGYTWLHPAPDPIVIDGVEHMPTVGKLLMTQHIEGEAASPYSCTATVVTSVSESLLITAGHCIWPKDRTETVSNVTFIPAYNGPKKTPNKPFGQWDVIAAIGMLGWTNDGQSQYDQAMLKVAPRESDGATIQSVVGSIGLTIGGSPYRGRTPQLPYYPHLSMLSYPVPDKRNPDMIPDETRAYLCEGDSTPSDQDATFLGAIKMPCSEPITGGASGAAFVEHMPGGPEVIATLIGGYPDEPSTLYARLNDHETKDMYEKIDKYVPKS